MGGGSAWLAAGRVQACQTTYTKTMIHQYSRGDHREPLDGCPPFDARSTQSIEIRRRDLDGRLLSAERGPYTGGVQSRRVNGCIVIGLAVNRSDACDFLRLLGQGRVPMSLRF